MTDPKPTTRKGRRLGGPPPTPSTLDDPTPPEAPGQLVPATAQAPAAVQQATVPAAAAPPVDEPQQGSVHLVPPAAAGRAERPRAEDIVRPREETPREQISVMVPKALELRKRMRRYWVDTEVEVRDQAALALDAWLRGEGY